MTMNEFNQGWAVILSQPWARSYRTDADTEATQRAFVKAQVDRFSGNAWQQACWFIASQWSAFPTTAEFTEQTSRIAATLGAEEKRKEKEQHPLLETATRALPGEIPVVIRQVLDRVGQGHSFRQAFHEILPQHPEDPDAQGTLERAARLLRCGHGAPNCWHVPGLPCPSKPWDTLTEDHKRKMRLWRHDLAKHPDIFRDYLDRMGMALEPRALPAPATWTPVGDTLDEVIEDLD